MAVLVLLVAVSCGYRLSSGTGRLPDGGAALSIPLAENLTTDAAASARLTAALRREAARAGLAVAADAPARIRARVTAIKAVPRGVTMFAGRFRTREQEVVVGVELFLKMPGQEEIQVALSDRESFLSAPDLRGTEANRQLALERVLERMAREGVDRFSRRF